MTKDQEIEFSHKYQPLFDLLNCWDELKRLSLLNLSDEDKKRFFEILFKLETEDSKELEKELVSLRVKGLDKEDLEDLEYWLELNTVTTVSISGGRDSGKSFSLSLWNAYAASDFNHRILFTRQTMSSTDNSIKTAIVDRMELLGVSHEFDFANNNFIHKAIDKDQDDDEESQNGKITIIGQKTSKGTETAKLKSLENYSVFETDEAEELNSYDEWLKIKRSLRAKDVQCLSILSFNPPTREHWIAIKLYDDVPDGFNGIKDGVMYIHTTYLDNGKANMAEHNWNEYEKKRVSYELYRDSTKEQRDQLPKSIKKEHDEYKYSILGSFKSKAEGVIYEDWEEGEFNQSIPSVFGLDFGSNDPDALVEVAVDRKNKAIYLKEQYFKNNTSTDDLYIILKDRCGLTGRIIADSAERRMILDYRKKSLNINSAKKGKGSVDMGIKTIQGYKLIVSPCSKNLKKALNNYKWHDKRAGVPDHDWSDLCDAFRYAITDVLSPKAKIF